MEVGIILYYVLSRIGITFWICEHFWGTGRNPNLIARDIFFGLIPFIGEFISLMILAEKTSEGTPSD